MANQVDYKHTKKQKVTTDAPATTATATAAPVQPTPPNTDGKRFLHPYSQGLTQDAEHRVRHSEICHDWSTRSDPGSATRMVMLNLLCRHVAADCIRADVYGSRGRAYTEKLIQVVRDQGANFGIVYAEQQLNRHLETARALSTLEQKAWLKQHNVQKQIQADVMESIEWDAILQAQSTRTVQRCDELLIQVTELQAALLPLDLAMAAVASVLPFVDTAEKVASHTKKQKLEYAHACQVLSKHIHAVYALRDAFATTLRDHLSSLEIFTTTQEERVRAFWRVEQKLTALLHTAAERESVNSHKRTLATVYQDFFSNLKEASTL